MLMIAIEQPGRATRTQRVEQGRCRIGRSRDCELQLASWRVGRVHAEVFVAGRVARIVDGGTLGGTLVNGERIAEFGPLGAGDLVEIGGFRLRIQLEHDTAGESGTAASALWRRSWWCCRKRASQAW